MKTIIKIVLLVTVLYSIAVAQDMKNIGQGSDINRSGQTSMNFLQIEHE